MAKTIKITCNGPNRHLNEVDLDTVLERTTVVRGSARSPAAEDLPERVVRPCRECTAYPGFRAIALHPGLYSDALSGLKPGNDRFYPPAQVETFHEAKRSFTKKEETAFVLLRVTSWRRTNYARKDLRKPQFTAR